MNKEYLEALNGLFDLVHCQDSFEKAQKYFDIIEQALNRLESIDNATPSEALKCLEKLKGMEISSMPFSDEYGTQEVDLNDIRKVGSQLNTDFREYTATIKQSLLKAQEPKHYLKWEDLEFKESEQTMKVLLNGKEYSLSYFTDGIYKFIDLLAGNGKYQMGRYVDCYSYDVQFFNDLHLERIE